MIRDLPPQHERDEFEAENDRFDPPDLTPKMAAAREWRLIVDGQEVPVLRRAEIIQQEMGIRGVLAAMGDMYPAFSLEQERDGAASVPFMIDERTGEVFVGSIQQKRLLQGGKRWNIPRGFLSAGETHQEGGEREVQEELRTGNVKPVRVVELIRGLNLNSAFFNTSGTNEDGSPRGDSIFGLEFLRADLQEVTDEQGNVLYYVFPEQKEIHNEPGEVIYRSRFEPVALAKDRFKANGDAYSLIGIAELKDFLADGS